MKVRKLLAMLLVLTMVLSITLPTAVLAVEGDDAGATVTQTTESTQPDEGGDTATVPDEGDDTATVPDEGGDTATVPDEGDDTATVPDEGTDPTPAPSESADPTPVPSESADPTPVPSESADPTPAPSESADPTPAPSEGTDPTPAPSESTVPAPTPSESTVPAPTETVEIPEATVPGAALCKHGNDPTTCPECAAQKAHEAAMVVAAGVYNKIMAATTLAEYAAAKAKVDPMYKGSIDALLEEYVATLSAAEQDAYATKIKELEAQLLPVLSFETVAEIYSAIMDAETKADYDAILAAISDEQKAELDAYVLTLTEEEQAAYAAHIEALMEEPADLFAGMEELYLSLLAAETLDDYDAIMDGMTEEQAAIFGLYVNAERAAALNAKRDELVDAALRATTSGPAVNYDNVAPLVSGSGVSTAEFMAKNAPLTRARSISTFALFRAPAATPLSDNPDGLVMDKSVSGNAENGYTITLESYVTGDINISGGDPIPTDIILVLDQSGSMENDIEGEGSYISYTATTPQQVYNDRNRLYVKVGDQYYRLDAQIKREWKTQYIPVNERYTDWFGDHKDPTNGDLWDDRERLYYLSDNGDYQGVTVSREFESSGFDWGYTYTYTLADETIIAESRHNDGAPDENILDRLFVSSSDNVITGYIFSYTINGQTVEVTTDLNSLGDVANWDLYTYQAGETEHRLDALKRAATAFVDNVKESASATANHRIAVVGFSSSGYNNTELLTGVTITNGDWHNNGENVYYPDGYERNGMQYQSNYNYYSQYKTALQNALEDMSTTDGQNAVYDAIDALTAHGGTQTDHGLDMAQQIFDENPLNGANRNRVVIVFTDGEPTGSGSTFSSTTADNAIKTAKDLKDDNVTVYTIGIFDNANGTPPVEYNTSNANKFMHYVSSNYPNATSMNNGGSINAELEGGESYYLSASDSATLNSIFEQISDQIQSGESKVKLTSSAIVQDVISDKFQLPEGTTPSDIKVYTQDATATGGWEARVEFTNAQTEVNADTGRVTVTNFDFSTNFVATTGRVEGNPSQSGDFYGRKLVIEIPIEPNPDFFGGNNIDTNADGSGIYADEAALAADSATGTFTSPNLNVEVKYEIDAQDQSIYLTQNGDGKTLIDYVETGMDGVSYVPNGWNNSDVTITYTVKKGNTTIGTYTIRPSQTSGSWTWEDGYDDGVLSGLTDCTKFNISCTVTPNDGTIDSAGQNVVDSSTTDNEEATVHVFKPTVSFYDQSTYLTVDPGENTYTEGWIDSTDPSAARPTGNAPTLTVTSVAVENADTTEDYVKAVKVEIGSENVTSHTSFTRNACTDDGSTPAVSNGQYVVHVFKPSITWKDTKQDYGYELTVDKLTKDNMVGEVAWTHTNSANVSRLLDTSKMPTLVYEFKAPNGDLPDTLQAETNVKVTVKVGDTDITGDTTFSWLKGEGCPDTCGDPNDESPAYQFRIHLNNFDLTVTKEVDGNTYDVDDNFLFTLQRKENGDWEDYSTFTLQAGESVTFQNLQAGYEYRVVEDIGWSWRYTCTDGATKIVGTISDGKASLTFTNKLDDDQWLSDEGRLINDFDGPAGSGTKLISDVMLTPAYRMDTKDDEDEERS